MEEGMEWMQQVFSVCQMEMLAKANEKTERFGLVLSQEEMEALLEQRKEILKREERIEFGEGILPKLVYTFCDSGYLSQQDYADTLGRLQEIFYQFKNEMQDRVTDEELLDFMREQFDEVCFGDLDYLESTCLAEFAQAVRAGYRGFRETDGHGAYSAFDRQERWNHELYEETLRNL